MSKCPRSLPRGGTTPFRSSTSAVSPMARRSAPSLYRAVAGTDSRSATRPLRRTSTLSPVIPRATTSWSEPCPRLREPLLPCCVASWKAVGHLTWQTAPPWGTSSHQSTRTQVNRRTSDSLAAFAARLEIGFGGRDRFKARLERHGQTLPDEKVQQLWDEATRPEGPPVQVSHAEFAEQMLETADGLLKYLIGRPWTLVRFDRRSLITSDSPVSLVAQPDANEWAGVGYMTAWGITMPLARKLGLIMGDPTPLHGLVPVEEVRQGLQDTLVPVGTTAYERFFNEHTIGHSSRWLYCHPDDEHRIPDDLPEPHLVNMRIQNDPWKFNGEPNGVL